VRLPGPADAIAPLNTPWSRWGRCLRRIRGDWHQSAITHSDAPYFRGEKGIKIKNTVIPMLLFDAGHFARRGPVIGLHAMVPLPGKPAVGKTAATEGI